MRIHLTPRKRGYVVLGNEITQDRRLSYTARGLLAYLLSLPDGAREDVRTLAEKNPGIGRRGVAKALEELIRFGYYVRETVRDAVTGLIRTYTAVYDVPRTRPFTAPAAGRVAKRAAKPGPKPAAEPAAERPAEPPPKAAEAPPPPPPVPAPPGPGEPGAGNAGTSPLRGVSTGEKPSLPEPVTLTQATGRGAALLARVAAYEPRLALSATDTLILAPLAERWVEHRVPELEARSLLADGLPPRMHSARHLLADRLTRKLPPPRPLRDPAAPAAPPLECPTCRDPRPTPDTPCPRCTPATQSPRRPALAPEAVAAHAADIRRTLRGMPVGACVSTPFEDLESSSRSCANEAAGE